MTPDSSIPRWAAAGLILVGATTTTAFAAFSAFSWRANPMEDARTHFATSARGLLESTPRSVPAVTLARADGHLARLEDRVDAESLSRIGDPRARLAWLEAAAGDDALGPGADPDKARAAVRRSLDLLASVAPQDPEVVLDRMVAAVISGEVAIDRLATDRLAHRPFPSAPDAICDRIVEEAPSLAAALLDHADTATRPSVIAAILSRDAGSNPGIAARLDRLDHGIEGVGPSVIRELARRGATDAIAAYIESHPESASLPGVRTVAIAAIATGDPEAALELAGDSGVLSRLPQAAQSGIRLGLARGHAARGGFDEAMDQIELAGQLDDRILGEIAIHHEARNPDRTLDGPRSLQTLAAGRLVSALAAGNMTRHALVGSIANLFRTGRFDLAYSLLIPNTTNVRRPADAWLPDRIEVLSEALAITDAAPDAWIPLIQAVPRIAGVDGQVRALAAVAEGLDIVLEDGDLPEPVRGMLSDMLVEIALRG